MVCVFLVNYCGVEGKQQSTPFPGTSVKRKCPGGGGSGQGDTPFSTYLLLPFPLFGAPVLFLAVQGLYIAFTSRSSPSVPLLLWSQAQGIAWNGVVAGSGSGSVVV